jgi:outer membrane protein OmpA-like peptidoglycan-associated protein
LRRVGLGALLLLPLLTPDSAHAFPAELEVIAKVSIGKHPRIIVRASQPAVQAVVNLKREDGQIFNFSLGNIEAGSVRELRLDGRGGRHSYQGVMMAVVDDEKMESPLSFETVVAEPITIQVSRRDLDLDARRLQIFTNRKVATAQLTVIGVAGHAIESLTTQVESWTSGVPILLRWKYASRDELLRLEVRVEDADGFYNAIQLTPWQVEIPHEEVHFATGSAQIADEEVPKLEESLERVKDALGRYSEIKGVQLFIAGHTDTQGSAAYNLNLSRKRAQAIAAWFVRNDLKIPVHFEGFGESALKEKTADEVDEPKNRRVDYLLGVEAPELHRGSWKRLN